MIYLYSLKEKRVSAETFIWSMELRDMKSSLGNCALKPAVSYSEWYGILLSLVLGKLSASSGKLAVGTF